MTLVQCDTATYVCAQNPLYTEIQPNQQDPSAGVNKHNEEDKKPRFTFP